MCYSLGMGNPKGVKRDAEQLAQLERRRLKAVTLFDRGLSQAEVARKVGVHRQSASRWFKVWQSNGAQALKKAGRAGRKPRLTAENLSQLERALKEGPEAHGFGTLLWTTQRVATVIERQTAVRYHPDHVCRLLQKLGWSCQRPTTQARERDEAKIARWRKVRWPALKKKPSPRSAAWSSLTKAD
jgi:transposase